MKKQVKGRGRKCTSCGSSSHQHSSHSECPFNKACSGAKRSTNADPVLSDCDEAINEGSALWAQHGRSPVVDPAATAAADKRAPALHVYSKALQILTFSFRVDMQSRISFVGCSCCRWVYDWGVQTRPCCAHRALPSFLLDRQGKGGKFLAFVSFSTVQPPWEQCQQLPYKNLCIYMQIHPCLYSS